MKPGLILAICVSAGLIFFTPEARADFEVSAGISINATSDFYEPLAPYGDWVVVGSYGRCWRPRGIEVGWRPYCIGHWEWTNVGWCWVSDEPWGWACYHYGSWVDDPNYGWVWVPATDWAPAWVVWREGGGYIGWAPCAPPGIEVQPSFFVFVGQSRFTERCNPRTVIVNNVNVVKQTKIINVSVHRETVNIGGQKHVVFYDHGPRVNVVEKAMNRKLPEAPVNEVFQRDVREFHHAMDVRRQHVDHREQQEQNQLQNLREEQKQFQPQHNQPLQGQPGSHEYQELHRLNEESHPQLKQDLQQHQENHENQSQSARQILEQHQFDQQSKTMRDERNRMSPQNQYEPEKFTPPRETPLLPNQTPPHVPLPDNKRPVLPPRQIPNQTPNRQFVPPTEPPRAAPTQSPGQSRRFDGHDGQDNGNNNQPPQ